MARACQRAVAAHKSEPLLPGQGVPRAKMSDSTIPKVTNASTILAPVHPNRNQSRQVRSGIESIATERKRLGSSARRGRSAREESLSSGRSGGPGPTSARGGAGHLQPARHANSFAASETLTDLVNPATTAIATAVRMLGSASENGEPHTRLQVRRTTPCAVTAATRSPGQQSPAASWPRSRAQERWKRVSA